MLAVRAVKQKSGLQELTFSDHKPKSGATRQESVSYLRRSHCCGFKADFVLSLVRACNQMAWSSSSENSLERETKG